MDVEDDALAIGESEKNAAAVISVQQRRVLVVGADRQMKALDFTRISGGYKLPDNKAVMLLKIPNLPTAMATKREPLRLSQSRGFSRDHRLGVPGDGSLSLGWYRRRGSPRRINLNTLAMMKNPSCHRCIVPSETSKVVESAEAALRGLSTSTVSSGGPIEFRRSPYPVRSTAELPGEA
jgi:hypothetical protein